MMTKRLTQARQLGFAHHRQRDIGQGPVAHQRQPACMGARRGDNGVDSVDRLGWLGRFGQGRVPRPVSPWTSLASADRGRERRRRAGHTGMSARPASASTARVLRVAAMSVTLPTTVETPRISASGCGAGVEQRQRIVDAGVDVDDERLRGWVTGAILDGGANVLILVSG